MREQARVTDLQAYQKPEFSHAEVLEITGLTADTLLTWYKRGVVITSEGTEAKGRGHRRKYSEHDVTRLMIMKLLAPTIPLPLASAMAGSASLMVLLASQMAAFRETRDELDEMPGASLLAYHDSAGRPRFDLVGDAHHEGLDPLPAGGISAWMRNAGVSAVTVLDINIIMFKLYAAFTNVRMRHWAR